LNDQADTCKRVYTTWLGTETYYSRLSPREGSEIKPSRRSSHRSHRGRMRNSDSALLSSWVQKTPRDRTQPSRRKVTQAVVYKHVHQSATVRWAAPCVVARVPARPVSAPGGSWCNLFDACGRTPTAGACEIWDGQKV